VAQPDHQRLGDQQLTVSQGMQGKVRKILTMDLENPSNRYLREPWPPSGYPPWSSIPTWR
jgi:hypothetical protein